MRKIIAICLGAGLILGAGPLVVRATEPAPQPPAGRVLILRNERTLTGDIEQVGEQFRVKRLVGETWVPAEGVLRLCASLEEAHGFLQTRANLQDPDERLRLAEWCRQHGLYEQAVGELKAAAQLRPNDRRIRRLMVLLEQARAHHLTPKPVPPPERPLPRVDVTAESLGLFASKVQPILMNACLRCHTAGRGGPFQLTRVSGPGMGNRLSLEQNLAAVLAEVDMRQPLASRLLTKALSVHAHGMAQAPLKGRQAPAYQMLERWVNLTLESNPQLREQAVASTPGLPLSPPPTSAGHWSEERSSAQPTPPPPPPAAPGRDKVAPKEQPPAGSGPATPDNDPVGPDGFNREFHPERMRATRPKK